MPNETMISRWRVARNACLVMALNLCVTMTGIAQTSAPVDLSGASLEDLMHIEVTSVSKKEQSLSKTAGSIYVITQDDIRRSGATNIPDLLRMVPGVDVARINANAWAISIRGFNFRYSSKVLVLVDGRTVYTELFSGVYWDQQSMPLENIDRIEVIRGPGGTVWGANAMNGVINIITKSAKDTQGGLISSEAGSQDRAQELAQYGGTAGAEGSYRVYGRYSMNTDSPSIEQTPPVDSGHTSQTGFRSDWNLSPKDQMTIQGDLFGSSESQTITTFFSNDLPDEHTFNDKVRVGAGNILGRWNHLFSDGSETTTQIYYDGISRFDQGLDIQDTVDADFQYHFHIGARNDVVAGLDYRFTYQSFKEGYETSIGTGTRRDKLFSSFIQDEITLTSSLALTMGVKLEHNAYTGFEYEPSVQLVYAPNSRQTVWASASRAIQQPAWIYAAAQVDEASVPLPGGGVAVYEVSGNPQGSAPVLLDYELGYRTELSKRLTLDATGFLSNYSRLQTVEAGTPFFSTYPAPPYLILPNTFGNLGNATDYGVEASAHWNLSRSWRISPGFSFLQMHVSRDALSNDTGFAGTAGDSPKFQAQLQSTIKLPHNVEWDTSVYYVSALKTGPVPAYTRLDTGFNWHIGESIDLSVGGQNLLSPRHIEFLDSMQLVPTEVGRTVNAKVTWHF